VLLSWMVRKTRVSTRCVLVVFTAKALNGEAVADRQQRRVRRWACGIPTPRTSFRLVASLNLLCRRRGGRAHGAGGQRHGVDVSTSFF